MNPLGQDAMTAILTSQAANYEEKHLLKENRIDECVRSVIARHRRTAKRSLIALRVLSFLFIALVAWSSYKAGTRNNVYLMLPTVPVMLLTVFLHLPLLIGANIQAGRFEAVAAVWLEQHSGETNQQSANQQSENATLTLKSLFHL